MSYDPHATEHAWDADLTDEAHLDALAEDAALAEYHDLVVAAAGTDPAGPEWDSCVAAETALESWVAADTILAACRAALNEVYGPEGGAA